MVILKFDGLSKNRQFSQCSHCSGDLMEFHVSINCTSDVSSKEIKIDIQMRQLNKVHSKCLVLEEFDEKSSY